MKNSNFKRILSTVLFIALVLMTVFAISACKKEHVHDLDTVTVEPTCTKAGSKTTTCLDPECDYKEVETLPAKGHDYYTLMGLEPTCTENGFTDYQVCSVCEETKNYTTLEALGHDIVKLDAVAATCTETGLTAGQYCTRCVEKDVSQDVVPALGHEWKDVPALTPTCLPGYTAHKECTTCGATDGKIDLAPAYEHLKSEFPCVIEYNDATCVADGDYTTAHVCQLCQMVYEDTVENFVIPALGHDVVEHEAQAPTCTEIGWDAYETCARCEDYNTFVKIDALGHAWNEGEVVNTVDPTCEVDGEIHTLYICDVCEESKVEVTKITAPGHAWGEMVEAQAPTCTEIGWNEYHVCTVCEASTYEEKAALGHKKDVNSYVYINVVIPTCYVEGSYDQEFICARENCDHAFTEDRVHWNVGFDHDFEAMEGLDPTCLDDGYTAYQRCYKCGFIEGKEVVPALGHTLTKYDGKAPTCTEGGYAAYEVCSVCDHNTYAELSATGHNIVNLDAVAPTCTVDGLTAGQYCTNCDACTVNQDVVPALGHNYDANGVCTVCAHVVSINLSVNANGVITGMGNCKDKNVVIPEYVNGVKVVAIASGAFKGASIESVVIPSTVKTIENNAFLSCASLKSVVIGDGVEYIADGAFLGCTNLTSVTIGSGVKSIGARAFFSCGNIQNVYYTGTAAQWNSIQIGLLNDDLKNATVYFI